MQTGDSEMIIRQDFNEKIPHLPPRMFLEQIMDTVTKIYCFIWDKKNEKNVFEMTWKDICVYYNKNSFRSNIRKLNNHGLLSYLESADGISIELTGWDEIDN